MEKIMDDVFGECLSITTQEGRRLSADSKPLVEFPKLVRGGLKGIPEFNWRNTLSSTKIYKKNVLAFNFLNDRKKKFLPVFSFLDNDKVTAIVLDMECHKSDFITHTVEGVTLQQFLKSMENYSYVAYYSASSVSEKERFRVVIPLEEPVPADEFDYCKDRLMDAFNWLPDIHSFESRRWFFMPSKHVGIYREPNQIFRNRGCSIDFYATTRFDQLDRLRVKTEKARLVNAEPESVINHEAIEYYLGTDFPMMNGNGDSDSSLYRAILVCLAHDDDDTLAEVLDKARSEQWSEKELKAKIKAAEKYLGR